MELRKYQVATANEEVKRERILVVAPMGSGKTLATLTALLKMVYSGKVRNVLIIAPLRVAKSVWVQEAEEYGIPLNMRYCKKALDIKLFLNETATHHICVVSVTMLHEVMHGCWDGVIVDESTLFSNRSAMRSKEARRIFRNVPVRILLTGTPIHGGFEKIWHQIFLLDGGEALGTSLTAFREKYIRIKSIISGVVTTYEIKPEMIPILMMNIRHLVFIVTPELELPKCLFKNVFIDLPPKRMREYKEFEQESLLEFEQEKESPAPYSDTKTLVSFAKTAKGMKLRQLASGTVYTDDGNETYSITHKEKIDVLKDIITTIDGSGGVLVAYQFRSEYEELRKAFPTARRLDTALDIDDWNAKRIPVALVHPASVGHGLNLQHGGNTCVWYSLTNCDLELYAQFNKRLDRPGQTEVVSIIHLIARDTIDEHLLKRLNQKQINTLNFVNF